MSDVVGQLRSVRLLSGLDDAVLQLMVERASRRRLEAGEWLFRQGDPGDGMFLVLAGSVEVLTDGPTPEVVARLGRGEALGELALLTAEPRSTSVRARRDTELLLITREEFERLVHEYPAFAIELLYMLGTRLRQAVRTGPRVALPPRTIALVPLHEEAPMQRLGDGLLAALAPYGAILRLGSEADPASLDFDAVERDHDRILLAADTPSTNDPWTRFCLRQADRVIGVVTQANTQDPRTYVRLRGCDLAFERPTVRESDLESWVDALDPRRTYVLRAGSSEGVARMARRLAGHAVGVVLSGGGARGFAHIGVVEELSRVGVTIDRLGGTSMGASVASLYAERRSPDAVASIIEDQYVRKSPFGHRTLPLAALSTGAATYANKHRLHGRRHIEGLDIPFFCVSADLTAQRPVIHRRGLLATAVCGSQALPALVPPVRDGERLLVDGAIFSNLPVEPMWEDGEGPVIAVDVSGRLPHPRPPHPRIPLLRQLIVGPASDWAPSITETIMRSLMAGNVASDELSRAHADVVIVPALRGVAPMKFRDLERLREIGRQAVRDAVNDGRLSSLIKR